VRSADAGPGRLLGEELASIQLGVRAADREELGVSPLLDQAAAVEDQDLVAVEPDSVEVEVASSRMRMRGPSCDSPRAPARAQS
jgi:hypothetical protein